MHLRPIAPDRRLVDAHRLNGLLRLSAFLCRPRGCQDVFMEACSRRWRQVIVDFRDIVGGDRRVKGFDGGFDRPRGAVARTADQHKRCQQRREKLPCWLPSRRHYPAFALPSFCSTMRSTGMFRRDCTSGPGSATGMFRPDRRYVTIGPLPFTSMTPRHSSSYRSRKRA